MPWLRLWTDILDDPDLHDLPNGTCWGWALLLAIVKKYDRDGELPDMKWIVLWTREPAKQVERWIAELKEAGLIEESRGVLTMHGWSRWQEPRDRTNKERQARYRAAHPKKSPPLDSPIPETDTDQTRPEGKPLRNAVTTPLRTEVTGVPSVFASDPTVTKVSRLAEELSGDVSWAIWVEQQSKLGHPPHAIEESLRVCVDSGKWDRRFAGGVLKRLAQEGYPVNQKRAQKPTNQPAVPPEAEIARIEAELSKRPRISPEEYERRRNAAS